MAIDPATLSQSLRAMGQNPPGHATNLTSDRRSHCLRFRQSPHRAGQKLVMVLLVPEMSIVSGCKHLKALRLLHLAVAADRSA